VIPTDGQRRLEGTSRDLTFPSGRYSFIAGHLDGVGPIETCSLFSPMDVFDSQEAVSAVAAEAIAALFRGSSEQPPGQMSRRQFLRPGATA
jgi:[NiFe] hydrogenase assembly HybE family chaperone